MAKDKQKLREILFAISSDDEKDEYLKREKLDEVSIIAKDIKEKMESDNSNEAIIEALRELTKQVMRLKVEPTDHTPVVQAIGEMTKRLSESNKHQDLSGFFKNFSVQIAQSGKSSKNTEELIKTLKWNSTMGIKNRNGSPISPAVAPFQVSDYDDVVLSGYDASGNPGTVIFKLGGGTVATITLTYDGSGNLTEARRT